MLGEVGVLVTVSEEEVFVAPLGGDKLAVQNKMTDQGFSATRLLWLVQGVDIVKGAIGRNGLKLLNISHVVRARQILREQVLDVSARCETQFKRIDVGLLLNTFLARGAEILQANFGDEFGGLSKLGGKSLGGSTRTVRDMVGEVVCKEVPVSGLTIDAVHGNHTG